MTKLILTQEVDGLGSAGDVVDVKGGYARNYLLPQGYAVTWTKAGEKQVLQIRKAREAREFATVEEARDLRDRLAAARVRLEAKAGQGGRLFGAIRTADIADAIEAAGIGQVDRRKIVIAEPIKAAGDYTVTIKLHPEVTAAAHIQVVGRRH